MKQLSTVLACATLAAGLSMSPASQAVTQSRSTYLPGGPSCQLSVPSIDTLVRPRATGFRNEGTTSAFVICQFNTPDGALNGAAMYVTSTDGVARNVTCTGVSGYNIAPSAMSIAYSTKTLATDSTSGLAAVFQWDASDFGGTAGNDLPNLGIFSVTCLLPTKTAINLSAYGYNEDVGT